MLCSKNISEPQDIETVKHCVLTEKDTEHFEYRCCQLILNKKQHLGCIYKTLNEVCILEFLYHF